MAASSDEVPGHAADQPNSVQTNNGHAPPGSTRVGPPRPDSHKTAAQAPTAVATSRSTTQHPSPTTRPSTRAGSDVPSALGHSQQHALDQQQVGPHPTAHTSPDTRPAHDRRHRSFAAPNPHQRASATTRPRRRAERESATCPPTPNPTLGAPNHAAFSPTTMING